MYGLVLIISILIGLLFIYRELKNNKIPNNIILLYLFMLLVFIIICGKLFTIYTSKKELNIITAGFSSYGGAIGAIIAVFYFIKVYKEKSNVFINSTILSLPLIYSLSKIACSIAGCCYGIEYNGLFHIYNKEVGFNVFPIQMLETLVFFLIFLYFNKYKNIKYFANKIVIVCALAKFLLDYLRYSHKGIILSVNQIVSLLMIIISIIIIGINIKKNNKEG